MLLKLTSSTSGEMIMIAEHGRRLFEIIGKARTARGVFTTEQLPEAIARLHAAIDAEKRELQRLAEEKRAGAERERTSEAPQDEEDDDEVPSAISLAQRALPLIRLMQRTYQEEGYILWEAARDF